MPQLPTDADITDQFARLKRRGRTRKTDDLDALATWAELEQQLLAAVKRARTPTPAIDGWPPTVGGDGRGGSELTRVEGSANRRIGIDDEGQAMRPPPTDVILEHAEQAVGYLHDIVAAAGALQARLATIARLSTPATTSETGGGGSCLACGAVVTGVAEDRLKRGLGPCCYSAWVRAGRPELTEFVTARRAS